MNSFSDEEWPTNEPISFNDFSIGEEQSTSTIISLAWSAPGLAKNKRSVLAVLTSNLLLSFWASVSEPRLNASWRRVFIVNSGIKQSWERRCLLVNRVPYVGTPLLYKMRIRSFAWSPRLLIGTEKENRLQKECFFLGVANDEDELLCLLISSPFLSDSRSWDCYIIKVISVDHAEHLADELVPNEGLSTASQEVQRSSQVLTNTEGERVRKTVTNARTIQPSLLKNAMEKKAFIDHITWGPWRNKETVKSVLTVVRNDEIAHYSFVVSLHFLGDKQLPLIPRFHLKSCYRRRECQLLNGNGLAAWYPNVSLIRIRSTMSPS